MTPRNVRLALALLAPALLTGKPPFRFKGAPRPVGKR